ncbi:MAG: ribosome hibernation-promoting factor, HPF/YfiA family [Thermoleophilia bacterium]|jgi:putative sigma-54 modulation protein
MQLQVKGKNVSVTDALFEHAERKLERLTKILPAYEDDSTTVELELSVERNPRVERPQVAEITVRTKRAVLRVHESADDMYAAIDQATHKLERQARRYRKRKVDHHARAVNGATEAEVLAVPDLPPLPDAEETTPAANLVKSKRFRMEPMGAEEAALHMDMLHHDFYVFRNEASGEVNVVYRRRDGDYGLIVPED